MGTTTTDELNAGGVMGTFAALVLGGVVGAVLTLNIGTPSEPVPEVCVSAAQAGHDYYEAPPADTNNLDALGAHWWNLTEQCLGHPSEDVVAALASTDAAGSTQDHRHATSNGRNAS